ncbi:hypothetical protein SAMN06264365_1411, partial [Actinoplanes regularis]
ITMLNAIRTVAHNRDVRVHLTGVQPYVAQVLTLTGLRELLADDDPGTAG